MYESVVYDVRPAVLDASVQYISLLLSTILLLCVYNISVLITD